MIEARLILNMKLEVEHREEIEEFFAELFEETGLGKIVYGGGISYLENNEVDYCDIDIDFKDEKSIQAFVDNAKHFPIAKDSLLVYDEIKLSIGEKEALALYFDNNKLPTQPSSEEESDPLIELIEELDSALEAKEYDFFFSYFESSEKTALYYYGDSFDEMLDIFKNILTSNLICKEVEIVQLV